GARVPLGVLRTALRRACARRAARRHRRPRVSRLRAVVGRIDPRPRGPGGRRGGATRRGRRHVVRRADRTRGRARRSHLRTRAVGRDGSARVGGPRGREGLPLAAVGGRAALMDELAPLGPVYQAGTLSGNPLATAAGLAVLAQLEPRSYDALERSAERLAAGLRGAFADAGVPAQVTRA